MKRCAISLITLAGLAQAEPFVFQGTLSDAGMPAEGLYDLEFELYDMQTGGSSIGTRTTIDDLSVSNGGFTAELDFGDVFDGSQRWIEIRVRSGDSAGAFTTLAPRAKVGNAPQASFASKAGVANQLSDPFWTDLAPGVLLVGDHEGDDKMFINFNRVYEPNDVLVVHSSANAPGGMHVSTWLNGMPYYGYASGGFSRAKTYYDPLTDAWVVSKGGNDLLEIDDNDDVVITNNLIVNGTITAMGGGGGGGTLVGYKAFTAESIFRDFGFERLFNSFAGAVQVQGSNGYLRADLDLPHGVTVTNIRVEYVDSTSANLRLELWQRNVFTLNFSNSVFATSTGSSASMVQVFDIIPSPALVIDNTSTTYALRAFATNNSWPIPGNLGIRSIVIEYEQPLP